MFACDHVLDSCMYFVSSFVFPCVSLGCQSMNSRTEIKLNEEVVENELEDGEKL